MKFHLFSGLMLTAVLLTGCAHIQSGRETIYQRSTIDALMQANYRGDMTFDQLKTYGDFGIGTFNDLDGELIGLDGVFYQMKSNSEVQPVRGDMKTPFAVVTFFDADRESRLVSVESVEELKKLIDAQLVTPNLFYAVKITGTFTYVKVRSVPRQEKPYRPLVEVVKDQPVYEFSDLTGTLVGFRCPSYVKGINVPGYHFHFITSDKTRGGHVLECKIQHATLALDETHGFYMQLPKSKTFYETDLREDQSADLKQVEQ